ncbi:hypothetical protein CVT24_004742, partial [Panaeolus cyanescens]
HYKKPPFATQVLEIVRALQIPTWTDSRLLPEGVVVQKVSGALTNAVFFVSYPAIPSIHTLLLRVYGSSSGSLISRPRELHVLHILSSRYNIGPRVYGTFENGRFEQYFDSVTLTPTEIRDPQISRWIAARMAELHSVDIKAVEGPTSPSSHESNRFEIAANVKSWLRPAEEVLQLPAVSDDDRAELDLPRFRIEWSRCFSWLSKHRNTFGSRRVFAHNDTQYGNLLKLKSGSDGLDEHRQIIVVDFEYAAPNPAAYDIANHFHEWSANYHGSTPHLLDPSRYPTKSERLNFYSSYIRHASMLADDPTLNDEDVNAMVLELEKDVKLWSIASHAGWAIWGIVQAREDLENQIAEPEFDYIGYAKGRMASFRQELNAISATVASGI